MQLVHLLRGEGGEEGQEHPGRAARSSHLSERESTVRRYFLPGNVSIVMLPILPLNRSLPL
jgi:hypothetical protein